MSLSIDTRRISAVFAFGQWLKVKPNTFCLDSFELWDIEEDCPFGNEHDNRSPRDRDLDDRDGYHPRQPHTAYYEMGKLYEGAEPEFRSSMLGDTNRVRMLTPSGSTGVRFIDPDTDEEVFFSLMECKGFRTVSKEKAIQASPKLAETLLAIPA